MPFLLLSGRFLALTLLAALAAAASAQVDARRPPLYLVEHEGAKVYLLGSVHVLPVGALPMPDHIESIYTAAAVVGFEVDLSMSADLYPELVSAATDEALIGDLLDDEQRETLHASLREFGYPGPSFDAFEPWFGSMSYGMLSLQGQEQAYGQGVDEYFFERAGFDGKEIVALETLADQIAAFDDLPDASQVEYLMSLVASADQAGPQFAELLDAWAAGDDARLTGVLSDEFEQPDVFESILVGRNRSWIPTIETLLDRKGDVSLVIFGAGHLVGRDNVLDLLRRAGYKPQRM